MGAEQTSIKSQQELKENNGLGQSSLLFVNSCEFKDCISTSITDQQIQKLPFRLIGQLHSQFQTNSIDFKTSINATGCLVAPDLILTSASNVYSNNLKRKTPILCVFTLGAHNQTGRAVNVIDIRLPKQFLLSDNSEECRSNDYALLKINPVFNQKELQVLKLMHLSSLPLQKDSKISVFGYPLDKNSKMLNIQSNISVNNQFGASGSIIESNNKFLSYKVSTSEGHSGSPLIYKNKDEEYEIVGVHKGVLNINQSLRSYGISVNGMTDNLKKWASEMNSRLPSIKAAFQDGFYQGDLVSGKREGSGVMYNEIGRKKYVGGWKNNKEHGKGIHYYANGSIYEGEFKNGKSHGLGLFTFADGDKYEGEFIEDHLSGKGVYFYKNGTKYDGEWKDNKKHGRGVEYYANGDRFDGYFQFGEYAGKGLYTFKSGAKYDGNFKEGKRNGKGFQLYFNKDQYEGQFMNDEKHGKGVYFGVDKSKYEGDFQHDKKHGQGVFTFANGNMYQGEFSNDLRNGQGLITRENKKFKVVFEMGVLLREEKL